jgi:hypothetical protein
MTQFWIGRDAGGLFDEGKGRQPRREVEARRGQVNFRP